MTIDEFEKFVKKAIEKNKNLKRVLPEDNERPSTITEIESFESKIGSNFPDSYRHLSCKYGCGYFAFTTVLSVIADSDFYIGKNLEHIPDGLIPIIDNECGDYYCFPVENGKMIDKLLFIDHEVGFNHPYQEAGTFFEYIVNHGLRIEN